MSDTELLALAAFVNGFTAEVQAANMDRDHSGNAMAYASFPEPDALNALKAELERRGVLKT
jgi:hypothetical protein